MATKKIGIFGDSITKPIILNQDKRYKISKTVNWQQIETLCGVQIENFSKMGATIEYGANYLRGYLDNNSDLHAAVIAYGGNDSDYNWQTVAETRLKTHLPKTPSDVFEKTLNDILDILQLRGIKPILMTLPPICASKYFDWITRSGLNRDNILYFLGDTEVIYRHQEYYSNLITKTAHKRGVAVVDVRSKFLNRNDYMSLMCDDGVHPNDDGGKIITDAFIETYTQI